MDEGAASGGPPYRAGKALLTLGLVLLVQTVAGVSAALAVMLLKSVTKNPLQDPHVLSAAILSTGLASAGATVWAARAWARPLFLDRTASGLGLFLPSARSVLLWGSAGAAMAALYLAMAICIHSVEFGSGRGGLLTQAAGRGGLPRLAWTLFALFIAPPSEELLFRGLLLKGLAASWGTLWASIVVTVIFVALHVSETAYYWPANIFILLLSVGALFARLRSGSLVASMALHAGYNGVIVVAVYAWTG
jgi:membrane protease YdiL (CAAX protease family)